MSPTQLSRRVAKLGEGRYVTTPTRQLRPAYTPVEQREHDTTQADAQEPLLQHVPDLVRLPSIFPRSGKAEGEDTRFHFTHCHHLWARSQPN